MEISGLWGGGGGGNGKGKGKGDGCDEDFGERKSGGAYGQSLTAPDKIAPVGETGQAGDDSGIVDGIIWC